MSDRSRKPRLSVPLSWSDGLLEAIAGLGLVVGIYAGYRASGLETELPVPFDPSGRPGSSGAHPVPLVVLVWVDLAVYIGFTILARYPHVFNYPITISAANAPRQYRLACRLLRVIKAMVVWLLAYIQVELLSIGRGEAIGLGSWFLVTVLLGTSLPVIAYLVIAARNPSRRYPT